MRIRATCNGCGRDFLFFQLYNADPWHNDRCPNCNRHLGLLNGRHLALAADRAATNLANSLRAIADRSPSFSVNRASVLEHIDEILAELSGRADGTAAGSSESGDVTPIGRRRFRRAA